MRRLPVRFTGPWHPESTKFQLIPIMTRTLILLGTMLSLPMAGCAGLFTTVPFNSGALIPDGDSSGLLDVRTVSGLPAHGVEVSMILQMTGVGVGGMINGDIYATLSHESTPGMVDAFSVLLNRPGMTATAPDGYLDNGLSLTFTVGAPDIHLYGGVIGALVGGEWGADGRAVDPFAAFDTVPRTAGLEGFRGVNPNGTWSLFVADVMPGGQAQLVSWSLGFTTVPEPGGYAGIVGVGLAAWVMARRRAQYRLGEENRVLDMGKIPS